MHFAALTLGRESVEQPLKYFSNNVYGTQIVLEVMREFKVKPIVFSSSATVYGNTDQAIIDEATVTQPLNPYGHSKVMMETMMQDVAQASDMTFVALRYFNVAGAKKDGTLGEVRPRLIPTILQVAQGKIDHLTLYGDDYNTPDGTCIRDYIHVSDLVEAHLLALKYLQNGGQSETFNLGSSKGYSNLEVLEAARKVTGEKIPVDIIPSAVGDAPVLIASSEKIHKILGWQPKSSNIEEIISDAWQWQRQFPNGYDVRS
jgi:UDP-glucose 4-epimerase